MIFAIDFDGTIVKHEYPKVGAPVPCALETIKELTSNGAHKVILYTMRSGDTLKAATDYLEVNGVTLYGVNHNPTQAEWTQSPKIFAHVYIDDAALGCPLIHGGSGRPYADWDTLRRIMASEGYLGVTALQEVILNDA